MNVMLQTLKDLLYESVNNPNHIPFNNFTMGGKEEDTFHLLSIQWNEQFIDIEGDVIQDTITFKKDDEVFLIRNVSTGWFKEKLREILNVLFPLKEKP